jgi:NDP-sugar pyrophosphorylase family protein
MIAPEDFFDLSRFDHAALFDNLGEVWAARARRPEYVVRALGASPEDLEGDAQRLRALVSIGSGAVVEGGAIVLGPAVIGPGCRIYAGSLVRGPLILGEGAVVGHGSEVCRSVLLAGAHVGHLNYVGDSILGNEVNLGAGAVCSNVRLDRGPVRIRLGGVEHETGFARMGVVLGDGVQVGCNAVLNPGTLIGPRTLVYPGACLRGHYPADSIVKVEQRVEIVPRRGGGGRD